MAGKGTALQDALEKWKKDQARNQALQTKAADDRAKKAKKTSKQRTAKGTKVSPAPSEHDAPLNMKAHLRTVKVTKAFDTPLSKQLKDSLDALQRAQEPLSAAELEQQTGHDCSPESQLAVHLARNPKVEVRAGRYRFRAAAEVKVEDRSGALKFIQSAKGCLLRDLSAAYPDAEEDIKHLHSAGHVYILPAAEKDQKAVFPRDNPPLITVSDDVLRLWHEVEVADEPEEQAKELRRANILSAVHRGKRERPKPAKKEKKKRTVNFDRFKRITNEHLPELFVGEAATSID